MSSEEATTNREQKPIPGEQAAQARQAIERAREALKEALQHLRPPRGVRDEGGD